MAWEREDISLDEAPASGTPYVLILQGPQLAEIDAALRHFQFPVERYTRAENIIIYVGISSHIAAIRGRQDHQFKGQPADVMLAHITDMRRPGDVQNYALAAYSDSEVVFHTDVGDIVSLFVLGEPVSGGESLLASGWTVYNALAETRPDLIHVLAEDWPIPRCVEKSLSSLLMK
ncbi:hypothetical protein APSETT445_000258 [Aspergillus pseudonomiae]